MSPQVQGQVPTQGTVAARTDRSAVATPYDEAARAVGERPLTRDEVAVIMTVTGPVRDR
ncbi:hypothetical protein GCM10028777_37130 [Angustibacter speluncae]